MAAAPSFCIPKTTRWASGSKEATADEENKTPPVIVEMRSANCNLTNRKEVTQWE